MMHPPPRLIFEKMSYSTPSLELYYRYIIKNVKGKGKTEIGTLFIRLSILRALGYPTEDGLARVLVSPLTSLQLGLRFLAVLYFSEELTFLLAKKRLP